MDRALFEVLMIEDDDAHAHLVGCWLNGDPLAAGRFRLARARSLAAGLEHLSERPTDAVLLDLDLPDSRGLETLRRIREHGPVPIVVHSASEDLELATQAIRGGAQEMLVKGEVQGRALWRAIRLSIERASLSGSDRTGGRPHAIFAFADFELDPDASALSRRGRAVAIRERPLALLGHLVRHRERVVSKAELFDEVWSGVVVSDAALASALKDLRRALKDDAAHPRFIETLRGRGYRFIAPVREGLAATGPATHSLALLPFAPLSPDAETGSLACGLGEAMVAELVGTEHIELVSRTTASTLLASDEPLPACAERLGVDLVLSGSVVRSPACARVTAQLLDAREDRHLWAERFDRTTDDALGLASEVARAIARRLRSHLAPRRRRERADRGFRA